MLFLDASPERREELTEQLAEAAAAWDDYLNPAGSEERPPDAPSWWKGDDEAATTSLVAGRTVASYKPARG